MKSVIAIALTMAKMAMATRISASVKPRCTSLRVPRSVVNRALRSNTEVPPSMWVRGLRWRQGCRLRSESDAFHRDAARVAQLGPVDRHGDAHRLTAVPDRGGGGPADRAQGDDRVPLVELARDAGLVLRVRVGARRACVGVVDLERAEVLRPDEEDLEAAVGQL